MMGGIGRKFYDGLKQQAKVRTDRHVNLTASTSTATFKTATSFPSSMTHSCFALPSCVGVCTLSAPSTSMDTTPGISGSCTCGNIRWFSTEAPSPLDFCYCRTCQKLSGAPFMAWMGVSKSALSWKIDRTEPFTYQLEYKETKTSIAQRGCCSNCSSNVSMQYNFWSDKVHVAATTIDRNSFETPKLGCHIWTKSVPSWYSIPDDGLRRRMEVGEDFQARIDAYVKERQASIADVRKRGGWWGGLMLGEGADYSAITPDNLTMSDLWDDPSKSRRTTND